MEVRLNIPHYTSLLLFITLSALCACSEQKEHTAPAINPQDSVSVMISYGINTLISDSGIMKYRVVAEKWEINEIKNPPRWYFPRGLFMEQFDEKFHVEAYIQADTAWYYDQKKLWHLRGRVRIRNINGLIYESEELFWDGITHEIYSYAFSKVTTPERNMEGTYFLSDEHMRHYTVSNSKGSFTREDMTGEKEEEQTTQNQQATQDTTQMPEPILRPKMEKSRRTSQ